MKQPPGQVVQIAPEGRGTCQIEQCRCSGYKSGGRGMSGLEVCTCHHLPQVHQRIE